MQAAWAWIKRRWMWVAGIGATLLAFVFYVLSYRKEKPSVAPEKQRELDELERARQAELDATARAERAERAAKEEADRAWSVEVKHAEETVELMKDNPEATDRFLDRVGDEMRRR